jgi:hypothetical protein
MAIRSSKRGTYIAIGPFLVGRPTLIFINQPGVSKDSALFFTYIVTAKDNDEEQMNYPRFLFSTCDALVPLECLGTGQLPTTAIRDLTKSIGMPKHRGCEAHVRPSCALVKRVESAFRQIVSSFSLGSLQRLICGSRNVPYHFDFVATH